MFAGFIDYSQEEYNELWSHAIFVVDTNILLNFYKYTTSESVKGFFNILKKLKEENRLWVPHQVALEYFHNYEGSMLKQTEGYKLLQKKIIDLKKQADTIFGNVTSEHPYIHLQNLEFYKDKLKDLNDELIRKIDESLKELPDSQDTKRELEDLLNGIIGEAYNQEKIDEIQKEGELRYLDNVPPGFEDKDDANKKNNRTYGHMKYQQLYGDLILWKQIIDKASSEENPKPIIFITEEKKADWWQKEGKLIKRPQPHLVQEFLEKTNQKFYMYRTDSFLNYARKYLNAKVSEEQVNEVTKELENIRKIDALLDDKQALQKDQVNILFRQALDILEEYEIDFEEVDEAVQQMEEVFTTVELVRFLIGGRYLVGVALNKAVGRVLSEGKELLLIEQFGRINTVDDEGRPTTTQSWVKR